MERVGAAGAKTIPAVTRRHYARPGPRTGIDVKVG
jgi:hypothetical protein